MSEKDKKVTICVIETHQGTRHIFRDLLNQAFSQSSTMSLRDHVEVVDNVSFSEILGEYTHPKKTLPELFREIELKAEAEDIETGADDGTEDGAQFIVDMIGELAAEATENIDTPAYIVFPDSTYGNLLGFFADDYAFDDEGVQILTMNEVLHHWLYDHVLEANQRLPWFGIIGGYGLCNELGAADNNADPNILGRRLDNQSYKLIETFLRPDWSNQEQVEDVFVGQVRQLVSKFKVRSIFIADEDLECTLLGLTKEPGEHNYLSFFNKRSGSCCNYLADYRGAWQKRMEHLYQREDWPEGVKLESVLTLYAEAIAAKVGRDYIAIESRSRRQEEDAAT